MPVVRWLQAGALAAGVGAALVVSPALASADDGDMSGGGSSTSRAPSKSPAAAAGSGRDDARPAPAPRAGTASAHAAGRGAVKNTANRTVARPAGAAATNRAGISAPAPAVAAPSSSALAPVAGATVPAPDPEAADPLAGPARTGTDPSAGASPVVPATQPGPPRASASTPLVTARPSASAAQVAAPAAAIRSVRIPSGGAFDPGILGGTGHGPLQGLFAGLFEFARRTLFNSAPAADPLQWAQVPGPVVVGTIGATDSDGDKLAYTVTAQPTLGTVTVAPDGSYTYTPSNPGEPGTRGSDSFTVAVRDKGFHINLLDLFRPRQTSVEVDVSWTNGTNDGSVGDGEWDEVDFRVLNATSDRALYLGVISGRADLLKSSPFDGEFFDIGETAAFTLQSDASATEGTVTVSISTGTGLDSNFNRIELAYDKRTIDSQGDLIYDVDGSVVGCDTDSGCIWHGSQPAFDQTFVMLTDAEINTQVIWDPDKQASLINLCSDGGPAANCSIQKKQIVTAVTVGTGDGGSGYTSAPTVTLKGGVSDGGQEATAHAWLALDEDGNPTDKVGGVTIDNHGFDYAEAPIVEFSGGGGSGATATASIGTVLTTTRNPRLVATVQNPNAQPQPETSSWSTTISSSDSLKIGEKASVNFKVFGAEVSAEVSREETTTWGESETFSEQLPISVPPYSIGYVFQADGVYKYFGDVTIPFGLTTYILRNVWFELAPSKGNPYAGSVFVRYFACDQQGDCPPPPDTLDAAAAPTPGAPVVQFAADKPEII